MEKELIAKQCCKPGEKYQRMVGGERRQNSQCLQVVKKRKGRKLESVHIKVVYGNPKQVKEKLGCHTAYIERTNLTDAFDEWEAGSQNAFVLKRASFA